MNWKEAALQWFDELSARGIMVTDAELNIVWWNQWMETHSGKSAAETIGRNLFDVYPDLVSRHLDEHFRDALKGRISIISQRLHGYLLPMPPNPDSTVFRNMQQSARIAPLTTDGEVAGTITVIDDVTERVERENRLVELLASEKAARAEAEAANRAKDEFLAIVSHELRTPLNAIWGWVQVLRSGKYEDSSGHALEAIERNSKLQAKLIEDILDASRVIAGKLRLDLRPVDLVPVVEAAIDTVRPAAEAKAIRIEADLDPAGGPVFGDPTRLQQVVWNLLSNAIKFTPPSGHVTVRLGRIESQIELSVSDTGQGIAAEFLPHVFDRFRQADSTTTRLQGGLGLGLAIARHLLELHGGTIAAESSGEGQGSTFRLRIPVLADETAGDERDAVRAGERVPAILRDKSAVLPGLEQVRVLVVEDQVDSREMLTTILARCGASVREAANTSEALEVLEHWQPEVLVSDIGMPGEDGYSLIRRVRSRAPEDGGRIPAVALTGYAGSEDRLRLLAAGFQVFVTKPVHLAELAMAIASLAGRTGRSDSPENYASDNGKP